MRNKAAGLLFIFSLTFLSSCGLFRSSKEIPENIRNARQLKRGLEIARLDFEWFTAKVRIKFRNSDLNFRGNGELKMQQDSLVWGKVSKFGFEAAQLKLDQEKLVVLNRLQSQYIEKKVEEALAELNLGKDAFASLQQLLVGDYPFEVDGSDEVSFAQGQIETSHKHELGNVSTAFMPNNLKMKWLKIKNEDGEEAEVIYSDYQQIEGKWLPGALQLEVSGEQSLNIELQFSNIELKNQETVDFEIPDNYTKAK